MRIGVVGAGMMGLATAHKLAGCGHDVTIFDASDQLGGLSTWHDYGPFVWDRFYHVILPSDHHLIGFIRSLGLGDKLKWRRTRTGVYANRTIHDLSSTADYLRFPLLDPWQKARLAWTILYGSLLKDGKPLERETTVAWLRRHSGRATFEKFWKPLLMAKLGAEYERVAATFIWTYIKRAFSARDPSAGKEHLGYVEGGYRTILGRLEELVCARGELHLRTPVSLIGPAKDGLVIECSRGRESFDRVFCTAPVPTMRKVVASELLDVRTAPRDVEYLGVLCLVTITTKPLCSYYVLNLADPSLPFTGVVGMSSLVDHTETHGLHLTYFPKYVLSSDPLHDASDDEVLAYLWPGIERLYPDLREPEIVVRRLNRARIVQPLQVVGYSELVPKVATRHPGLFVLNTSQFAEGTLNNNEVIGAVNRFSERHPDLFQTAR
jgi:protoporphyrinogen oxidase